MQCDSDLKSMYVYTVLRGQLNFRFLFRALLERVTIVEDNPSIRSTNMKTSASIKERSKVPFCY